HLEVRDSRLLKPDNPDDGGLRSDGYELHLRFHGIIKMWLARFKQPEPHAIHKDAHWRSSLLCKPPLRKLTLGRAGRYWVVRGGKKSPVTLGDLYDVLRGTARDLGNHWRGRKVWYTALRRRKFAAAVTAVFATTELLEAVLLRLPYNALLTACRVRRQWDHTIQQSVKAQQKLFKISSQAMSAATESGTFDYKGWRGFLENNKYKEDFDAREPWYIAPKLVDEATAHPRRYQLHPRFHCIFHIWMSRYRAYSQEAKGGLKDPGARHCSPNQH
ncbi:hypothetical protein LTR95_018443, partial [Oleoguttula sp. CCFEE 5521]